MKIRRRQYPCEVPAVAMGDIAFNLLVFFVILAKAQDDSHVRLRPAASAGLQEMGQTRASVAVDVDNKLFLNGQMIGISQLESRLNEILGNGAASAAELRECLTRMHGKPPQEVLGLVAQSGLARAMFLSTLITLAVVAVLTAVPFALNRATGSATAATAKGAPEKHGSN